MVLSAAASQLVCDITISGTASDRSLQGDTRQACSRIADRQKWNSLTSERMLLLLRVEMGGMSENLSSSPLLPFSSSPFSFAAPGGAQTPQPLHSEILEQPCRSWHSRGQPRQCHEQLSLLVSTHLPCCTCHPLPPPECPWLGASASPPPARKAHPRKAVTCRGPSNLQLLLLPGKPSAQRIRTTGVCVSIEGASGGMEWCWE